jgi:hypothetical protein
MKKLYLYIALATLVAGVLDIVLACLNSWLAAGTSPYVVLRYIAAGIFGPKSFTGGREYEAIGLFLHFLITFLFVVFYFFAARRTSWSVTRWLAAGIVYGVFVYLFMKFVVIPLSNIPPAPLNVYSLLRLIVIQVIATGIPISYFYKRYRQAVKNV